MYMLSHNPCGWKRSIHTVNYHFSQHLALVKDSTIINEKLLCRLNIVLHYYMKSKLSLCRGRGAVQPREWGGGLASLADHLPDRGPLSHLSPPPTHRCRPSHSPTGVLVRGPCSADGGAGLGTHRRLLHWSPWSLHHRFFVFVTSLHPFVMFGRSEAYWRCSFLLGLNTLHKSLWVTWALKSQVRRNHTNKQTFGTADRGVCLCFIYDTHINTWQVHSNSCHEMKKMYKLDHNYPSRKELL